MEKFSQPRSLQRGHFEKWFGLLCDIGYSFRENCVPLTNINCDECADSCATGGGLQCTEFVYVIRIREFARVRPPRRSLQLLVGKQSEYEWIQQVK